MSTPDVIFCDFNAGVYPDIKEHVDYVLCSGVFEYIRNPQEFLRRVTAFGRIVLMSYHPLAPRESRLIRLSMNWINHFQKAELEGMFDNLGLTWAILHIGDYGEVIYSLEINRKAGEDYTTDFEGITDRPED